MKDIFKHGVLVLSGMAMAWHCRAMDPDFARFVATKQAQIRKFAGGDSDKVPSIVWSYFDALRVDDWQTATNLANRIDLMGKNMGTNIISPLLRGPIWQSIGETIGAYTEFHGFDNGWLHRFGTNNISSIPTGSIYFGGTDPGRYVVSALCESQSEGRPFFTFTQNQLVDERYLGYLQILYGGKLYIPTTNDVKDAFNEYLEDAQKRLKAGTLKPGEDVWVGRDGHVHASGTVSVMAINGLLVKKIFNKNPGRECYIEESYRLDWMYPQLSPHGLIMQLHREPLTELSRDDVEKDSEYWKRLTADAVGDWLTEKTSVQEVCDFCEKVYLHKDLKDFKGDSAFAKNEESQKTFSKLRTSIAGIYVWRAAHAQNDDERRQMNKMADLAFRQAVAMCPYSPEAVYNYTQFLAERGRPDDAILIAETASRIKPDDENLRAWLKCWHERN